MVGLGLFVDPDQTRCWRDDVLSRARKIDDLLARQTRRRSGVSPADSGYNPE
jgi:hypothetical protein